MFTGVVGSLPYAAPEMFSGLPYRGPPAEMFALGVLLFVIVMGAFPFKKANEKEDQLFALLQKDDTEEYWQAHRDKFKYIKNIATPGFRKIIKSLLTRDLSKRLSLGDFISHPWMAKNYASDVEVRTEIIQRRAI